MEKRREPRLDSHLLLLFSFSLFSRIKIPEREESVLIEYFVWLLRAYY